MRPGEYFLEHEEVTINAGRTPVKLVVRNSGDRPIQVGSHFHFFETNRALLFEREKTLGMRLNVPAGTAIRFEPGQSQQIELIEMSGSRSMFGFNRLAEGDVTDAGVRKNALANLKRFIDNV